MKLLKNQLLDDQEVKTSKIRWIYDDVDRRNCIIEEINLETKKKIFHVASTAGKYWNKLCIRVCPLLDGKSFCYSEQYTWNDGVAFIIDKNYKVQFLRSEIKPYGFLATFYDNFVYMFGNQYMFRYNLTKKRWEKLTEIPSVAYYGTCISLNGMIIFTWSDSTSILVLDLWTFSYSSCFLNLNQDTTKVLCKSKDIAYLIDFSGSIWESDKRNHYTWKIIGNHEPLVGTANNFIKAFYKNSWFFNIDSNIFEFNLDNKTVKKTKETIKNFHAWELNKTYN